MYSKNYIDTYRHKGLRKRLVQTLRSKGIRDERVLAAIQAIPRHFFLDKAFEEKAYEDIAFPIERGQTISQPYTVAFQTELLALDANDKVLEIGTGSAYQACVLAEILGRDVYTIERHEPLYNSAVAIIDRLGYRSIKACYGDGFQGLDSIAPFDKILITAAVGALPVKLWQQLKVGGMLVMPLGETTDSQQMVRFVKTPDGSARKQVFGDFQFVPMLSGTEPT